MRLFRTLHRTKIAALLIIAFILLSPAAFASPLDSKRTELKNIDSQIKVNNSKQAVAQRRQADIRRQIEESSQKLVQMQTRLNALQTELNEILELAIQDLRPVGLVACGVQCRPRRRPPSRRHPPYKETKNYVGNILAMAD